jgi:hypothetical protein
MSSYYTTNPKPKPSNLIIYFWYFIFFVIIKFLLITSILTYIKNIYLKNYAVSINNDIINVQKENIYLEKQIFSMLNDPVYRESLIRKELKMGKTGEIVIKKSPSK